jgi:hypothetical protein
MSYQLFVVSRQLVLTKLMSGYSDNEQLTTTILN